MEELRLEKSLEAEQKAVQDAISMTVKKRREEMESSYDSDDRKTPGKAEENQGAQGEGKKPGNEGPHKGKRRWSSMSITGS